MIAVRPPEYWPRPDYFALMDAVDSFVIADTFQYSRQSFQNRTTLRTPDGRQWISIPLKGGSHGLPIDEVEIRGSHRWIARHWRALLFNYRTTPFFAFYEPRLKPLFETEWHRLRDLTVASITLLREFLGIGTPLVHASRLAAAPSTLDGILHNVGSESLVVPRETFEVDARLASAVMDFHPQQYRQNFEGFEAGMSALDLLFNYGPETLSMIRNYARIEESSSCKS